MALVAHVLSDDGVAMISYNAMPGGHVRLIMREMLMNELGQIDDFEQRIAAARSFLEAYSSSQEGDEALATVLRQQAQSMLQRPDSVLFHDELGDCYHPQRLVDVVRAAEAVGLRHLSDAGRNRHLDGFLKQGVPLPDDPDEVVLRDAVADDYASLRYFRHTLLVRAERPLDRMIDTSRISGLYLTTKLQRAEGGTFKFGGDTIEIADKGLADRLEGASKAAPNRIPVSQVAENDEQLRVILQLFAEWYVTLHVQAEPFPTRPGVKPRSSPLVRAMIQLGELTVCTLDHQLLKIEQAELRNLLLSADGNHTLDEIASMDHGIPAAEVEAALTASANRGLIVA